MPFTEAKEHAPGQLHAIFADPYSAFENHVIERQLHLRVALGTLVLAPMSRGQLLLRVIHGWENGGFEPSDLAHSDHRIGSLDDLRSAVESYHQAFEASLPFPQDDASLLARPLENAIIRAEANGQAIDEETRTIPARWPAFDQGLYLYTFFKVYHRLTYGEDETYRSISCMPPAGHREVHEFHLEEGEFAVVSPTEEDTTAETILVLHESQLVPMLQLLEACRESA